MKYLKRIFESNEMDDMKKYIYECFVDFLDENAEAEFDDDQDLYIIKIKIKSFRETNRREAGWDNKNISRFVTSIDRLKEAATLIEECIEKVQIKYPDIEYSVSLETNENSINNMFISVPFYLGQEDINNLDMGGDTDNSWNSADFFGV
jgi:hypothetical protein